MPLRKGLIVALACLGCLATAPRALADPITLYTAYDPNNYDRVDVAYSGQTAGYNYTYVNSLPSEAVTTINEGALAATVTSNLSTSLFQFGTSLTVADQDSFAEGLNQFEFTAGVDTTYSLSGSLTVAGSFSSERFGSELVDVTNGYQTVYYHDSGPSNSPTQTLDSSGGPLSGLLTAGDIYYFSFFNSLTGNGGNATLTGTGQITFTQPSVVPDPSSWIMLGLGALLPFRLYARRRRGPA